MKTTFCIFLISSLFMFSCSGGKESVKTAEKLPEIPEEWTVSRPISSMYYIGIGHSLKNRNPDSYTSMAKDEALRDLASEIEVNVNSRSLLYTLEREYKFEEEFTDNIKTSTNLDLEGYELLDTYENDKEYWVYYRLSKADHAAIKAEKKKTALARAFDFYTLGKSAEADLLIKNAASYYIQCLQNLENYWNESNEVFNDGKTVLLDIEAHSALNKLISNINLAPSPSEVNLNVNNDFTASVKIEATDRNTKEKLPQVPVKYSYYGSDGKIEHSALTDNEGAINLSVLNVDNENPNNQLKIKIDRAELFSGPVNDPALKELLNAIPIQELNIPIHVQKPVFYISGTEKNLNKEISSAQLVSAFIGALSKRGYLFAPNSKDADLIIEIKANTSEGNSSNDFFVSYLTADVQVFNKDKNKLLYQTSKNNIKGVDLNYEKAGIKAYTNLINSIDQELIKPIITDLL